MALNKKARCLNGDIFKESSLLWLVRWYGRYALYYADLKEMAAERGLKIERSKICRWVQSMELCWQSLLNLLLRDIIKFCV